MATKSQKRTKSDHNNNNKKKLPWVSMQMYRVPLNPEQAVLTCCDVTLRAVIGLIPSAQCVSTASGLCGAPSSAISS